MPIAKRHGGVRGVVESQITQRVIIAVILINAAALGLETVPQVAAHHGPLLQAIDRIALAIFVIELAAKACAYRTGFVRDPWNLFDAAIVGISLVPHSAGLSVLRALRILRALRLISTVPSMRRVVSALLSAIPGMASIAALLMLVLYVAAVMAAKLYGATNPEYFGDLGSSLFTLFQVMTGESWSNVARAVMDHHPWAWLFFVGFILVCTFVVLNLFIAVVVRAMEEGEAAASQRAAHPDKASQADIALLLAEISALRAEIQALRKTHGIPEEDRSGQSVS
ncbi:ion transporter [Thermomonospora sp. CIF 1]|uniref:ion transporter n=1 Tax=Thermomonospora sp. CIF 1 TaxID=1916083 RepID=UPI000B2585AF|nr:ion transporter [Thermomonospora sp. CIF 1]PKK15365.1 MAG: ion transporter [Thermomonospora sp. CIF 1]